LLHTTVTNTFKKSTYAQRNLQHTNTAKAHCNRKEFIHSRRRELDAMLQWKDLLEKIIKQEDALSDGHQV